MDYLPLFAAVKDRPVLVIGGGEIAARKIAFLRRAGAHVQVVAQRLEPQLQQLADAQSLHWLATEFDESQLNAVFLVIAATNDSALNRRVFDAANARHRLVNVVDDQPLCSFIFPSIVDRSPLLVAISSGGNAPVLARLLREKIEALLPGNLGRMAEVAGRWRTRIKAFRRTADERRRFWETAFRGRFASLMAAGDEPAAEKALEAELAQPGSGGGEIILVGAGPGDAGLLTLRGLQVIQQADVVFYDHLVSDAVLELVRRDAEKICVGKRAGSHAVAQHDTQPHVGGRGARGENGGAPERWRSVYLWTRRRRAAGGGCSGHSLPGGAGRYGSIGCDSLCRHPADTPGFCPERYFCYRPL